MHILQTVCDLTSIVVVLHRGRPGFPGIQIHGPHTGKQGHVEDIAPDADVVLGVERLHMEAGWTLADATHYQARRKLDPVVLMVNHAAALFVDLAGSLAIDPDAGYLENVQGALVNPFHLRFAQYSQGLNIANKSSCCHRLCSSSFCCLVPYQG